MMAQQELLYHLTNKKAEMVRQQKRVALRRLVSHARPGKQEAETTSPALTKAKSSYPMAQPRLVKEGG